MNNEFNLHVESVISGVLSVDMILYVFLGELSVIYITDIYTKLHAAWLYQQSKCQLLADMG